MAEQALKLIATLYDIEREIKELSPDERLHIRRLKARPAADLLHAGLMARHIVFMGMRSAKSRWRASRLGGT
jgi:glucose-6-phosphate dehydrogenase assembly protein OpcA